MTHRFSHVAVTVPADWLEGEPRGDLLRFYGDVFGWTENESLSIPGRRIFLRAPTDRQYLTIRAADTPMQTSGYEHLGFWLESEAELREIHQRAAAIAPELAGVELGEIRTLYGGSLVTFRVLYALPLTIEVQHLAPDAPSP